ALPISMMYGHVDHPEHWLGHLRVLGGIARETGGFTEFVALPFVHHNAPIYLAGVARPGPTMRDNRAVHAFARLALHGLIDNVQCSWVKLGDEGTAQILRAGPTTSAARSWRRRSRAWPVRNTARRAPPRKIGRAHV